MWNIFFSTNYEHNKRFFVNINPRVICALEAPPHDIPYANNSQTYTEITKGNSEMVTNGTGNSFSESTSIGEEGVLLGSSAEITGGWGKITDNMQENTESHGSSSGIKSITTTGHTVVLAFDKLEFDYYTRPESSKNITENDTDMMVVNNVGVSYLQMSVDEFNRDHQTIYNIPYTINLKKRKLKINLNM
jgi:hypothetical protein